MSATSLVSFNANANAVESYNEKMKTTTVRLLTAKEFKGARGLKGNAASTAYNAYLREHGQANTEGLAAAMVRGDLLVRSARDSAKSLQVSFIKKSMIKDRVAKVEGIASLTREQCLAQIAALDAAARNAANQCVAPACACVTS